MIIVLPTSTLSSASGRFECVTWLNAPLQVGILVGDGEYTLGPIYWRFVYLLYISINKIILRMPVTNKLSILCRGAFM
jgi:hypothetical protein